MAKLKYPINLKKIEGKIVHTSEEIFDKSLPNILAQKKINASKSFQNGLLANQTVITPKFMSDKKPNVENEENEKETYEQNEETGLNC